MYDFRFANCSLSEPILLSLVTRQRDKNSRGKLLSSRSVVEDSGLYNIGKDGTVKPLYNGHQGDPIIGVVDKWSVLRGHLCNISSKWDLIITSDVTSHIIRRISHPPLICIIKKKNLLFTKSSSDSGRRQE